MSTGVGPPDPLGGDRGLNPDDGGFAGDVPVEEVGYADGVRAHDVPLTEPVEGTVTRREVITPAATDPVTVVSSDRALRRPGPCWNRIVAGVLGVVYLLVGVLGFFLHSGGAKFAGRTGPLLLNLFQVNGLHNVVHLAIGAVLVLAALSGHPAARSANLVVAVAYAVVGVLGIVAHNTSLNVIAVNGADNALHLVTAAVLALTVLADRGDHEGALGAGHARAV